MNIATATTPTATHAHALKPEPVAPPPPSPTGGQAQSGLMAIMQMAHAMGATFDQVQQLIRREEEKAYTAAFAAFSAESIEILKTNRASVIDELGEPSEYDYEELSNVLEAVKPHLSRHGLTISFKPERVSDLVYVTCTVKHVGGHCETATLFAEPDDSGGKNHVQAIGSVVTYLERYLGKAILGLAAMGQDKDGRGACEAPAPAAADPLATLRDAGNAAAQRGIVPLTDWWRTLDAKQRKALSGPFGQMRKTARKLGAGGAK